MFRLEDWIVDSRLFKTYFDKGPGFAAAAAMAAFKTRSRCTLAHDMTRQSIFSAFAWKI